MKKTRIKERHLERVPTFKADNRTDSSDYKRNILTFRNETDKTKTD